MLDKVVFNEEDKKIKVITSYKPGPNLDPTNAILSGCPTPLKLVLCLSIKFFIIGSKLVLFKSVNPLKSSIKFLIIS